MTASQPRSMTGTTGETPAPSAPGERSQRHALDRPRLPSCRVIIEDSPGDGAWNMAADTWLLEQAVATGAACLRVYGWSEPTLSLGYFQSGETLSAHPIFCDWARVRRLTGGGAILHGPGIDLTYSFAVPDWTALVAASGHLYDHVNRVLIRELSRYGWSLTARGESVPVSPEPELCFLRADTHDLLQAGTKVIGSAQRRRRSSLLQHGSLLLRSPAGVTELRGLLDPVDRTQPAGIQPPTDEQLPSNTALAKALGELLAEALEWSTWTPAEQADIAARIAEAKPSSHG